MQTIKYYPLIDCDSTGTEKMPMFFTTDERIVRQSCDLYLQEVVENHCRLCSASGVSAAKTYIIHCPLCGKGMKPITPPVDNHRLALYRCPSCNK